MPVKQAKSRIIQKLRIYTARTRLALHLFRRRRHATTTFLTLILPRGLHDIVDAKKNAGGLCDMEKAMGTA
jgi:hypothetical protein